ncbi:MAG: hypothetical protein Q8O39_02065 [bacterium]|nr:hypothetical protein [bacterium]
MVDILIFLGIIALVGWAIFIYFVNSKFSGIKKVGNSEIGDLRTEIVSVLSFVKKPDIDKISENAGILVAKALNSLFIILKKDKKENKEMNYLKEKQEEKFKDSNYWKDIKNILKRK